MELLSISTSSSSSSSLQFSPRKHLYTTTQCYMFKPKASVPSHFRRPIRSLVATPSKSSRTLQLGLRAEYTYANIELSDPQTPDSSYRSAEADVMELLLKERIVFLGSGINDLVADAIIGQLLLLDAQDSTKDIKLFINSSGGDVYSTLAIFDVIQHVRADISTVALGVAQSTASIILGCGTRGKRFAMPNARIMMHQPFGGASGPVHDLEIQSREVEDNKNTVVKIISDFTGRPFEKVKEDINKDRYMSPVEALDYGVIDGVIDRDRIIPVLPIPEVEDNLFIISETDEVMDLSLPEIPDDEIY